MKTTPAGVAISDSTWSYVLSVMLVGDFDRNGSVDWLLWLTDEAVEGNYRGYQSLLIKDVPDSGLLRATSL